MGDPESAKERTQQLLLEQALAHIRRQESRILGRMPRMPRGRRSKQPQMYTPAPSTPVKTIEAEADEADRALLEIVKNLPKTPRYRKFVLVQRADGGLEFRQDELCAVFDEMLAEERGRRYRPRVIEIDPRPVPRARRG
jgi:hypothetical protein